ncbi:MAG TPA: hypothetical protein VF331_18965 [Polyangiales bacterium]
MKKQRLPTLAGGKHARRPETKRKPFVPRAERAPASRFVVAVVPGVLGDAPALFAAQLLAAFTELGVPTAALVTHDDAFAAHEAEAALAQLLQAGARQSTLVRALGTDARTELGRALEAVPPTQLLLALGHALPMTYRVAFCVLVTGPHPAASAEAAAADLVLASPTPRLASDLARVLSGRFHREAASDPT